MEKIYEGLRENDLQYLVSNYISIDQYTSKLDDDNITIAFFCNELEVANDLKDFIEKNFYIEIRDIEISDSLTEDNKYILFVELERNINFPKIIMNMIDSIDNVTNNKKWSFKTFDMNDKKDLTLENLNQYVRLSKLRDVEADKKEVLNKSDVQESYKPIILNDHGWSRTYYVKGYVSQDKFESMLAESKSINTRDDSEIYLLENNFPGSQIVSTDSNVFIIKNNKILMLG